LGLIAALLAVLTASLFAQSADDLPSAPSAARSAAPKPAPPPSRPQPATSDDTQPVPPAAAAPADQSAPNSAPTGTANAADIINEEGTRIRTIVNEVSVVFTVTDKHNHYIKDLTQRDFQVLDDDHPVEQIRSFHHETNLPLQVGLLIDASNSIRDRFKFEQQSAIEFLNETIRPRYDKAFVIGFDVEPEVTQDFTDNLELLGDGVRALRPGGGTAMYDALYYACRDKLLKSPQTGEVRRRAIILVSDGEDNSSHVTREEAIEMALRANTIVYTISTNFPGGGNGDKVLQRIADATGGRAFEPFQLSDVANAFQQIQDDLRSQYELAYSPANFAHDGRYRTIAITALHKGLKVRSRSGYYAPTE
jgi:VWFA-related protein